MDIIPKSFGSVTVPEENRAGDSPSPVDAQIRVWVADGGLTSYLSIEPPEDGGVSPSLEGLHKALSDCGVSFQIDQEKLQVLAETPTYHSDILIAEGNPPVNGADGTAVYQIYTDKKSLAPREMEGGLVDYRDLNLVESVDQGQILCLITPPTEGTPGISVKGEPLPQKKGRPIPLGSYLGKNTELNVEGTAIISKIDGQVEIIGSRIQVTETFFVKGNVDLSTGNVKVVGNLVINGTVLPGFQIEAGGNIDVSGTVESATIKAGGNIRLKSGITGSELQCEGDLKSRFIENCNITVKGNIKAEYVLHSFIKCGKTLKTEGSISRIIGGRCLVGQNIESRFIGSSASVRTLLELGADPTLIERQQELQELASKLEKQIDSLKPLVTMLRQLEASNRLTPEKKVILQTVEDNYTSNSKLLDDTRDELNEISRSVFHHNSCRIICTGTIYPETRVSIGHASLAVTDMLNNTSLFYRDGEILMGVAR